MACPVVTTGDGFLLGVLEHVDCQAQVLGSYGFQSLAQPGGIGAAMLAMVHAVQLAILEPWAASALQLRGANYATPAVPTELMALNLAFAIAANLSLAIIARVAFQRGWISVSAFYTRGDANRQQEVREPMAFLRASPDISRADYLALSINRMEQRQGCTDIGRIPQAVDRHASGDGDGNAGSNHSQPLGETYRHSARRADRRSTLAGQRRDSNE